MRHAYNVELTRSIESGVGQYEAGFLKLASLYGRRGHANTGMKGKFRARARAIETIVSAGQHERLMMDLLALRRHQRNFLASSADQDARAFAKGIVRLKADLLVARLSPQVKLLALELTADYNHWFERYVQTDAAIEANVRFTLSKHKLALLFTVARSVLQGDFVIRRGNGKHGQGKDSGHRRPLGDAD